MITDYLTVNDCYQKGRFGDFEFYVVFQAADVPTGTPCQTYFNDNYFGFQRGFDVTWDGASYTPVGLPADAKKSTDSVVYRHFANAAGDIIPLLYFYDENMLYDGLQIDAYEIGEGSLTKSAAYSLTAKCDVFGNLTEWALNTL